MTSAVMKGRHQFKRRFSLQPSFMKDDSDEEKTSKVRGRRLERHLERESSESGSGTAAEPSNNVKHKIVVMGSPRTGKSSIIQQFLYNTFSPKYKRTIEEMHHGDFEVNGVHLTLEILDTSGENEFPAMRNLSISNADAFILVYDICDMSTFEDLQAMRDQILETKGSPVVPIVVVGNKLDLAETGRESPARSRMKGQPIGKEDFENGPIVVKVERFGKLIGGMGTSFVLMTRGSLAGDATDHLLSDNEDLRFQLGIGLENGGAFEDVHVEFSTTESVVTVDWENGFVEASAKDGTNVSKIFKELLNQAKVKYNLSPALRRKRRQSLPPPNGGGGSSSAQNSPAIPSLLQLQHLEQIREKQASGGKRNSCVLS